jgi:uncharacterized BrkB/YihY/UPF0761 family membrane protein
VNDNKNNISKSRLWVFAVYLLLLIIAIPWYWPKDSQLIIAGLPAWVFVAILISIVTSIFTAYLLLRYPWSMDTDADE